MNYQHLKTNLDQIHALLRRALARTPDPLPRAEVERLVEDAQSRLDRLEGRILREVKPPAVERAIRFINAMECMRRSKCTLEASQMMRHELFITEAEAVAAALSKAFETLKQYQSAKWDNAPVIIREATDALSRFRSVIKANPRGVRFSQFKTMVPEVESGLVNLVELGQLTVSWQREAIARSQQH
jgi:hypothetical protein